MVKIDRIEHTVVIPEGVNATIDGDTVTITGPKGSISRDFSSPRHDIFQEGGALIRSYRSSSPQRIGNCRNMEGSLE